MFGITVKVSLASLFSLTEFVRFVCCSSESSFREITPNSKLAAMNHQNIINSFDDNNPKGLSKTSNWVTDKCYTTWMRWATFVIFSFTTSPRCRLWDDFFFQSIITQWIFSSVDSYLLHVALWVRILAKPKFFLYFLGEISVPYFTFCVWLKRQFKTNIFWSWWDSNPHQ